MNRSIKVDFVMRSDASVKPGGDSRQVAEYAVELAKLGFDVRTIDFRSGMKFRDDSLVHIINVDRPYDFLSAVRAARGHLIVVSPIHHDLSCVRQMRKAEVGQGLRSFVGRWLPEAGREFVAFAVRGTRTIDSVSSAVSLATDTARAVLDFPHVWRRVGSALDEAHSVALLANGEADSLKRDTAWSGANGVLVPNGVPDYSGLDEPPVWHERPLDVCVVGRIEPRKRSVEVARALAESGLRCVFVGPAPQAGAKYASEFKETIESSDNLTWLGNLPHAEVQSVMRSARVLVNASWVEVQSLVDIEAVRNGCWVVTGRGGNSAEWMEGRLVTVDTSDVGAIVKAAAETLLAGREPSGRIYSQSWAESAGLLAEVYGRRFATDSVLPS